MRYYNPEIERLFDEAKSTSDRAVRAELYRQIVDIVVAQDVAVRQAAEHAPLLRGQQARAGRIREPEGLLERQGLDLAGVAAQDFE